jgi:hypothetical protein
MGRQTKYYFTWNEGMQPFMVAVDGLRARVYMRSVPEKIRKAKGEYTTKILDMTCRRILVGFDCVQREHGSSMLLELGPCYVLVSASIMAISKSFMPMIETFYSPLGSNNGVPYPVALGGGLAYDLTNDPPRVMKTSVLQQAIASWRPRDKTLYCDFWIIFEELEEKRKGSVARASKFDVITLIDEDFESPAYKLYEAEERFSAPQAGRRVSPKQVRKAKKVRSFLLKLATTPTTKMMRKMTKKRTRQTPARHALG